MWWVPEKGFTLTKAPYEARWLMSDSVLRTRLRARGLCVLRHGELGRLGAALLPISQMRKPALTGYGKGWLRGMGGAHTVGHGPGCSQPCAVLAPHPRPRSLRWKQRNRSLDSRAVFLPLLGSLGECLKNEDNTSLFLLL